MEIHWKASFIRFVNMLRVHFFFIHEWNFFYCENFHELSTSKKKWKKKKYSHTLWCDESKWMEGWKCILARSSWRENVNYFPFNRKLTPVEYNALPSSSIIPPIELSKFFFFLSLFRACTMMYQQGGRRRRYIKICWHVAIVQIRQKW